MRLKLGAKISLGFFSILALMLALGIYSYVFLSRTGTDIDQLQAASERLHLNMQIENSFTGLIGATRGYVAFGQEEYYRQIEEGVSKTVELEKELLTKVQAKDKDGIQNLIDLTAEYGDSLLNDLPPAVNAYFLDKQSGNMEQAEVNFKKINLILSQLEPTNEKLEAQLNALVESNDRIVDSKVLSMNDNIHKVLSSSLYLTIAALIIGLLLSVFLTRVIRNPILQMVTGANNYAQGDFRDSIQNKSSDEIGELAASLNAMQQSFGEIVNKLKNSSGLLSDSAEQLAAQAQQTSAGAMENASTMGEIAGTIDNMAQNTQEVSRQAVIATEQADRGFTNLEQVNLKMQEISEATSQVSSSIDTLNVAINKISQFVQVIDNIADQTNLLALNAAIEAARAGDAGRGFAVVADEVRKLAEESARSTKEIRQLIEEVEAQSQQAVQSVSNGNEKVFEGNRVVDEVGGSFNEIINAVRDLSEQVQSVAAASEQVSAGVQNVAATTEEQTAAMEEVSAATVSLNKLAEELNGLVQRFKV